VRLSLLASSSIGCCVCVVGLVAMVCSHWCGRHGSEGSRSRWR
jgi:hypothetical protein